MDNHYTLHVVYSDDEIWSLEELNGNRFLTHVCDGATPGPRVIVPLAPGLLTELARADALPVHDARQLSMAVH